MELQKHLGPEIQEEADEARKVSDNQEEGKIQEELNE